LQGHEIGDGLVAFIGVVDGLQADVFFVLKQAIELDVLTMEGEFGKQKEDVFPDERAIASEAFAIDTSCDGLNPIDILLRLFHGDRVTLLKDLVDGNQSLEGLDLVGEDGLDLQAGPEGERGLMIPGVDDTASDVLALGGSFFDAGGFADVDGQVGFRLGHVDITASAVVVGHAG